MSRWRDRVRTGQCIECGKDWQTVAHGGWINVCEECQPIRQARNDRTFAWAIMFLALGFVVQIVAVIGLIVSKS